MRTATTDEAIGRDYRLLGALFIAAAAMLFASKALFAKALYAQGVGFEALTTLRALLSLPLFYLFVRAREGAGVLRGVPRADFFMAAGAGIFCYYVGALTDFYALTMIDASIERVLIFSYPAIVVLFTSALTRSWPERKVLVALALTYAGIFFVVGGFEPRVLRANLVGAGFVLVSALSYAIFVMIGERVTRRIGSGRFTLIAMGAATGALAMHLAVRDGYGEITVVGGNGWILIGALAVLCMFLPALLQAEGVRRIGAQRASVIGTVGPPTTIVLAWLLLGERMTAWQFLGVALIVGGILVLDLSRKLRAEAAPE